MTDQHTIAIIQARLNSTRFPGKVLADLEGKPVLKHVIDRVREAKRVDDVIVATCYPGGGAIYGHCEQDEWDVDCYIHDGADDVLGRFGRAADRAPEAGLIVRVCGDNPLIVPEFIDRLVAAINDEPRYKKHYDYAAYRYSQSVPAIGTPWGYFGEVFTAEALQRAGREATNPTDREHVTSYMYHRPERFSLRWLSIPKGWREKPKTAVDTPEDLERVAKIIREGST